MGTSKEREVCLSMEDKKIQAGIVEDANRALAILGRSFIRHGSGSFLNLGCKSSSRKRK